MKGQCLCGAVRFEAEGVDRRVHACHCAMCRSWTGGPMLAVTTGVVRFEDESTIAVYDSSAWAERGFCTRCGSGLFYRLKESGQMALPMGILEDQSSLTMGSEIFVDHAPSAYAFAGDHPRLTESEFMASLGVDGSSGGS